MSSYEPYQCGLFEHGSCGRSPTPQNPWLEALLLLGTPNYISLLVESVDNVDIGNRIDLLHGEVHRIDRGQGAQGRDAREPIDEFSQVFCLWIIGEVSADGSACADVELT